MGTKGNLIIDMMVPLNLIPTVGEYIKFPMIEDPDEFYKVLDVLKLFYAERVALEISVG